MKERKNVYNLPAGDKTLEWYGKAVIAMKKRPTTDPTSWNYLAAVHGFDENNDFWKGKGPFPSPNEQSIFWKQCQHGSWFFFPWHRMYLAYFEQIVAQTIVDLGGPSNWALPYWDYSDSRNPRALTMPGDFTMPADPSNGLWMQGRKSTVLDKQYVGLESLSTLPFTGDGRTAPLGFGGPQTSFSHSGGPHGELEDSVHDMVHVMIGGAMGNPRTAGLDPIFWLHHCNIDRLWQVWLNMGNRSNPTKSAWLDFSFNFHDSDGKRAELMCSNVENSKTILDGYTYEGVPSMPKAAFKSMKSQVKTDFSIPLEVVAATNRNLSLAAGEASVQLAIPAPTKKVFLSRPSGKNFKIARTSILHLENITGTGVPPIHDVFVQAPNSVPIYAGSAAFFGIEEASEPSLHHSGSGLHYAFDITGILAEIASEDQGSLKVTFKPVEEMEKGASVTIGRVSLYQE